MCQEPRSLYICLTNVYPSPSLGQMRCLAHASQLISPTCKGGVIALFCNEKLKPREARWLAEATQLAHGVEP